MWRRTGGCNGETSCSPCLHLLCMRRSLKEMGRSHFFFFFFNPVCPSWYRVIHLCQSLEKNHFCMLVQLKPGFQNTCKPFSLTVTVLNQVSERWTNASTCCGWKSIFFCIYTPQSVRNLLSCSANLQQSSAPGFWPGSWKAEIVTKKGADSKTRWNKQQTKCNRKTHAFLGGRRQRGVATYAVLFDVSLLCL